MVAGAKQAHERGIDRRHAGGGGKTGLGAFEQGQAALEHGHRGVAVARIDEAVVLALEPGGRRLGAVIDEA